MYIILSLNQFNKVTRIWYDNICLVSNFIDNAKLILITNCASLLYVVYFHFICIFFHFASTILNIDEFCRSPTCSTVDNCSQNYWENKQLRWTPRTRLFRTICSSHGYWQHLLKTNFILLKHEPHFYSFLFVHIIVFRVRCTESPLFVIWWIECLIYPNIRSAIPVLKRTIPLYHRLRCIFGYFLIGTKSLMLLKLWNFSKGLYSISYECFGIFWNVVNVNLLSWKYIRFLIVVLAKVFFFRRIDFNIKTIGKNLYNIY